MRWLPAPDLEPSPELLAALGGHPLVAASLARRGLDDPSRALAFLDPALCVPDSPYALPGMRQAVDRLAAALQRGERILVWGDFDVDGQTATTLLVTMLRDLGAQPAFHIPIRAEESHGVSLPVLRTWLAQGVDLLLTCDTGVASHAALAYAASQGVDVIVTDHHTLPEELPVTAALVNPHLLPAPDHPMSGLPGVGVAFQLARALYEHLERPGGEETCLDLVALGIVADVAQQTADTRYWLQLGLRALRQTTRLGLLALFENTRLNPALIQEDEIGFLIAPRLNALGRLGDANLAVEFFTTHDLSRARILAQQLEGLNGQRKLLSQGVFAGALAQLQSDPALLEAAALVVAHPSWPAGVIGPVASRLAERYARPVVLLSAPPGEPARASARSVPGVDITAALAANAHLLHGFGGHSMAAGFNMDPALIPELRRALSQTVLNAGLPPEPVLLVDGELDLGQLSLELAADLDRLAPFGAGNPPLTLVCPDLHLLSSATLGREEEHLVLVVEDKAGRSQRVLWWGGAGWSLPEGQFDLAFRLRGAAYRGERQLQLEWIDFRPAAGQPEVVAAPRPVRQVRDLRAAEPSLPILRALIQEPVPSQIWAEGEALQALKRLGLPALPRHALAPAARLVVWCIPPGPQELAGAIQACDPQEIVFFAVKPGASQPVPFLARLAGLLRYALRQQNAGQDSIPIAEQPLVHLAAALAQPTAAVVLGLECLSAAGHITFNQETPDVVRFWQGGTPDPAAASLAQRRLAALLDETAAYRAYFTRVEVVLLL